MHIRVNDTVEVIAGGDKGTRGKVLKIDTEAGKITVQGVGLVYRHLKPTRNSQGGRLSKEMPINISNVALIDPSTDKPTRTGVRFTADGTKELYAKKSKTTIRVISKADPKYAKKA